MTIEGRILSLISGGIDSTVAAYMASFEGKLEVYALNFDIKPYIGEEEAVKPLEICNRLKKIIPLRELHIVPHGGNLAKIVSSCSRKLTCIICKRLMLRIASRIALEVGASALVTGDSLGQVASQTLANLRVEDEASSLPVLRPLLGLNKNEIISIARRIGTYEVSASKPQTCRAAPSSPTTEARVERVRFEEGKLPLSEMVEEAVRARRIYRFEGEV